MRRCAAVLTAAAAVAAFGTVPASAAEGGRAGYVFDLRAAAAEAVLDMYDGWLVAPGYSGVRLDSVGIGRPFCEAVAAGVYDRGVIEERVWNDDLPPRPPLSAADAAPASPGGGGGLFNPTLVRDTSPNLSPGENLNDRRPRLRQPLDGSIMLDLPADGNGVRWQADCTDGSGGRASAANGDAAAAALGAAALGSVTAARVDPRTGVYAGSARAFVAGLRTPAGVLDVITSAVTVRQAPGRQPIVSYRIGVTGGPVITGLDVPLSDLAAQVNTAAGQAATELAALGEYGITLAGPTASVARDGHSPVLHAPLLELAGRPAPDVAGRGPHQVRLFSVAFTGSTGG